jgi:mono/diheme cytochrome c family protein
VKANGTLVVFGVLLLAAAATGAGVVFATEETPLSAQEQQGKQLFDRTCIYCHGPGVWGTNRLAKRLDKDHALLENRTDLSAAGIRAIVRSGVGSMPPLRKTELTDADVDAIAAYLTRKAR